MRVYHIGISGGKDSTALLLWMVNESGIPPEQMIASFCDTQNEAAETYEHILMLSKKILPVQWLETEGFIQLAKRKQRFPSTKRRFCTQELKLKPTKYFVEDLSERYDEVIACSGVRRGESPERAKLQEWGDPLESYFGLREWRPLIDWTLADVLAIHKKYGIPLNPLYEAGATRVGCFPCINSNKREIRVLIEKCPARIDQIREWETEFNNSNGMSTFFPRNKVPMRFRSKTITAASGKPVNVCTIDDVVAWAKTGWRAKGDAPDMAGLFQYQLQELEPEICLSQSMACE
jgi:3'-phosphoadenosine 5'-phosphosulfate sulfotransferase (PAPS reductase)/FAD synthetase